MLSQSTKQAKPGKASRVNVMQAFLLVPSVAAKGTTSFSGISEKVLEPPPDLLLKRKQGGSQPPRWSPMSLASWCSYCVFPSLDEVS